MPDNQQERVKTKVFYFKAPKGGWKCISQDGHLASVYTGPDEGASKFFAKDIWQVKQLAMAFPNGYDIIKIDDPEHPKDPDFASAWKKCQGMMKMVAGKPGRPVNKGKKHEG